MVASPLKYHGGKSFLASRIVALMPPHKRYLEAYSGGLSVLLAKDGEGVAEFANDTNEDLVNFWFVLSDVDAFSQFRRRVNAIPLCEGFFELSKSQPYGPETRGVDRAAEVAMAYFVKMRQSRQGLGKDYCTPTKRIRRGMNENVSAWLSAVDGLPEVHQRLRRVEVWNRPAIDAIKKLDSEDTVIFCDPPYLPETRSTTTEYGNHEMTPADHVALLDCLAGIKGKFLLSGYRSTMYDSAAKLHGWTLAEFDLPNNASSAKVKQRKTECVWMNYVPEAN